MNEIEHCLNCTATECNGDYPHCNGKKMRKYQNTKLRQIGRGNAVVLVSLLFKLGYKRTEIAKICFSSYGSISRLMRFGMQKGLITQKEVEESRIYKRHVDANLNS